MHQNSKPLLTGKSLNSLGALNRVQASQFKRQRLDGSHKTREEFVVSGRPAVGGGEGTDGGVSGVHAKSRVCC